MSEKVIEFKNIAKKYCFSSAKQSLVNSFLSFFRRTKSQEEVWALRDVNFSVKKGQILGIIGENASGKTTILRIISKITVPTVGAVKVKGKVAGLLDLGAGFHPELTGRENVYLDAALYGLSKKDTDDIFNDILAFSGLEHSIDSQVKTYSQGMLVRLGFSVAVHVSPDIFLIDDSLAVGDEEFQRKCLARIIQMNKQGKTIVIVSHDLDSLSRIASRGILLQGGQIIKDDSMHKSIIRYVEAVGSKDSIACIDNNNLSIIFNNGKIVLLFNGQPITCDFGGYLSLKVLDKWMMSWQARWKVTKSEKDYFRMQGKWANSDITADIEVKLTADQQFSCVSRINIPNNIKADKAVFGFMFNSKYKQYLDSDRIKAIKESGNFAVEQWLDLYRTDEFDAPLVLASDDAPAVWASFKSDGHRGFGLIQTKDKSFDASVIQAQLLLDKNQSVSCTTQIQLLDKDELKIRLDSQQEKRIIKNDNLMLKLKQRCFHLFVSNRQVTKASGITFGFFNQGHFYSIFDGRWKLEKRGKSEFLLKTDFPQIGIRTCLKLSLNEGTLLSDLKLHNEEGKSETIDYLQIDVFLINDYKSYFALNQENDFLTATEFDEKVELEQIKCGFVGLNDNSKDWTAIILKSDDQLPLDLYNSRAAENTRHLRIKRENIIDINTRIIVFTQPKQKEEFLLKQQEEFVSENSLSNDTLTIDSLQDRIRVFIGDRNLTALDGFTSGMFFNQYWYESAVVTKRIDKKDEVLRVKMQRKFPKVAEYWEFELKQHCLIWNVYLEPLEQLNDLEYKAGIILNAEFSTWINAYEKGRFEEDLDRTQKVEIEELNSCLLGGATNDHSCCVLLENNSLSKYAFNPLLQVSAQGRFLQFCVKLNAKQLENNKKLVFSAKLIVGEMNLMQKEIDKCCQNDFSIIPAENYKMNALQHKAELYYCNRIISAGWGLGVCFDGSAKLDSFRANWDIQKKDAHTFLIRITYRSAPFCQNWYLEARDGCIHWRVEIEVFEQVTISSITADLLLPMTFKRWITENSHGRIKLNKQEIGLQSISIIDNRSGYLVLAEDDLATKQSAAVVFSPLVDMSQWLWHMYKPVKTDSIALGVRRLLPEQDLCFSPGKYEIFRANLEVFSAEKKLNNFNQRILKKPMSQENILKKGKIKLIFEKAKIKLFYADKELTHGLSIYTAIKANGQWADSSLAMWQVEQDADTLSANVFLNDFNLKQTQKIKLISDNEILWQICFDLGAEPMEQIAAGIMLSKQFTVWHTDKNKQKSGVFSDENKADIWQQIALSKNFIGVSGPDNKMPRISWQSSCSTNCDNIIEGTDKNYNSRVLLTKTKIITDKNKQIEFNIRLKINP